MSKVKDALLENMSATDDFPVSYEQWEVEAKKVLAPGPFGYIRSGAGGEETLRSNRNALEKYAIVPRVLKDVSVIDTSIELLGRKLPYPILLAPVGMQGIAHEEGELATARGAAKVQIPYIASTVSTYSLEQIAEESDTNPKWFQLYWSTNEEISFHQVARAEEAGYEAIVLTVDTVMFGWREEDMKNKFSPLRQGYAKANYENDTVFMEQLAHHDHDSIIQGILDNIHHPTLSWEHVTRLQERTSLPIILKGILHPEDALLAVEHGVAGVIVSNHGGRQLDGAVSPVDVLAEIVRVVDGKIPVIFDGGIRRGADVVKAIALGADAVLVGRPYVYGLALGGQAGVERVLENLIQETKVSLALAGARNCAELRRVPLFKKSY